LHPYSTGSIIFDLQNFDKEGLKISGINIRKFQDDLNITKSSKILQQENEEKELNLGVITSFSNENLEI